MSSGTIRISLILLVAAAAYFAGDGRTPLWDRDEPRYAQCSRQMLQSGDWVVPRIYDKLRTQKPPLIYWCEASAMKLFGQEGETGAFAARFPSSVAALLTLVLLAVMITRHVGVEQAMWTTLVLSSSAMTIVAAKMCVTDSVLTLFIIVAQLCVYAIWRGNRSWRVVLVLAAMLGLGILTKGPFIFGVTGSTAVALAVFRFFGKFKAKQLSNALDSVTAPASASEALDYPAADGPPHPTDYTVHTPIQWALTFTQTVVGLLVVAAIALPWFLLIHHRAPEFLPAMWHEGAQHLEQGKEGHGGPPGYHLFTVWAMFLPWSLLLPLGLIVGIRNRNIPEVRFALAALLGTWVMVEFIKTKLPHYLLSAYPAMAFLVAFAIRSCLDGKTRDLHSKSFLIGAAIWALLIAGIGAIPWLAAIWFRPMPWAAMAALTIGVISYAVINFALLRAGRLALAFCTMGIGMLIAIVFAFTLYLPYCDFLRISVYVGNVLKHEGATLPSQVRMVDYKEPSLAFYQGGTIREYANTAELVQTPPEQWPRWTVITRDVWIKIPPESQRQLRIIDRYKGWAYADKGRVEEVLVIERPPMH